MQCAVRSHNNFNTNSFNKEEIEIKFLSRINNINRQETDIKFLSQINNFNRQETDIKFLSQINKNWIKIRTFL